MYERHDDYFGVNGYELYFTRFANSILNEIFPEAKNELSTILDGFTINRNSIIQGGGGKSKITQSLEKTLYSYKWEKKKVTDEHLVDGVKIVSESHEIDHYRILENGSIGLEIEWNNKDPFYDRDLENFRKLQYINSIAIGIIINRVESLQNSFQGIYESFLDSKFPFTISDLKKYLRVSDGVVNKILKNGYLKLPKEDQLRIIGGIFTHNKFGQATTHMDKLLLRIDRGLGNPCPLILIGIGDGRLK